MATNLDILAFLREDKEARAKEKEEESKARAIERKEDMEKISEMITTRVKKEVENALKPVEDRMNKQDELNTDMARQFKFIMKELETLKEVMRSKEYPALPEHSEQRAGLGGIGRSSDMGRLGADGSRGSGLRVRDMCSAARKVIGLTPIEPKMLEIQMRSYGAKNIGEAMLMEVKSYLKCEMKVLPSEIEKLDIVRIFHPAKDDWNVLYVEFSSEYQVNSLYSYTKVMKKDNRLMRWVPKQMYERFSEVESYAYSIRKEEHLKTRVKIGQCDFELSTREPSSSVWKKRQLPANLPEIEVNPLSSPNMASSPPPGRPSRAQMLSEALAAVNANNVAIAAAAKVVDEKRQGETNDSSESDRKRPLSPEVNGDAEKAPRLDLEEEDSDLERQKSVSPASSGLLSKPDLGYVVSSCSTGGTPSKLGLMDTDINFSFNQNNITIRKSLIASPDI